MKKLDIWVFTTETIEERMRDGEKWTEDDFQTNYYNRTSLYPNPYAYFASEEEATEAWEKEQASDAYHQQGYNSRLIFYTVLEFERREYELDELPATLDKETLQRIVEHEDACDIEALGTKFSPSEEDDEEEE